MARTETRHRDLRDLHAACGRSPQAAKVKAEAERRTHGMEKSDLGIVPGKPANNTRGAAWRSRWREGPGATGDAKETARLRTQSREAQRG